MTEALNDHLSEIAACVSGSRHVLLFFDFDGTLAPIVEDPAQARMPAETRQSLVQLAGSDKFSLAIISGRALSDLRERVGLENLIYAGNHGLEISGPGFDFVEPEAARQLEALGELSQRLRVPLRHVPGVEVENKVLSASVHFRRAPAASLAEVREMVEAEVDTVGSPFEVTEGRKVFEIRPRVDWHKGMAVGWIREGSGHPEALCIYVGDDLTDEDAFLALPGGITVSVGQTRKTSARYYLEHQESVQEFLIWLTEQGLKPL